MDRLPETNTSLQGIRVKVLGRLAAMNLAELREHLKARGMILHMGGPEGVDWIVLGENSILSSDEAELDSLVKEALANLPSEKPEVMWESELWRRLGLVNTPRGVRGLYTAQMIAQLLHVSVPAIRRWHRLGLLVPTQVVCRVSYFDYQEVVRAKALCQLASRGVTSRKLLRNWVRLAEKSPFFREAFRRWPIILKGDEAFFREGEHLIDFQGQLCLEFPEVEIQTGAEDRSIISLPEILARQIPEKARNVQELLALAETCEEEDDLHEAIEAYRLALAIGGPQADICFRLAEVLYRIGDRHAAKERYFMAIELDNNFAEAYVNLGSVLNELEETHLAIAAYQGAIAIHPDYADAHFLLAQTLEGLGRRQEATIHWQRFLELVPEGPWCEVARAHLV